MKTHKRRREQKQNDKHKELQQNPTNIMEQTPWPGNHEYKPWPGYTQARLLWIHQNHHLQWQFTSGQQS
jgi:hypothetical protein